MKSLSKDKRNRLVLVAIGTVGVIAGLWQGVIGAQRNSLEDVMKKMSDEKIKIDNGQRLVASAGQFQKNLETTTRRLQDIEDTMASGDMYSWFIQTVNKFKEGYRVQIPQYSREVPVDVGLLARFPYKAVLFNLRGTAYFHDFGRFIADFENRFPYFRVQNIELEPVTASAANGAGTNPSEENEKLAFRMEVVTLVQPHTR
jgi:hypothetical protein